MFLQQPVPLDDLEQGVIELERPDVETEDKAAENEEETTEEEHVNDDMARDKEYSDDTSSSDDTGEQNRSDQEEDVLPTPEEGTTTAEETEQADASETEEGNTGSETADTQGTQQVGDVDLLARLVNSEARGEPYEGKVAVAEVVLNRVNSPEFPNSIEGVVYDSGQFQVVSNGSINEPASETSIQAAQQALNGSTYAHGALYFYNYNTATDRWLDTLPTITQIGQHTFK